jgi:cytochrome c oxidase subunit 3
MGTAVAENRRVIPLQPERAAHTTGKVGMILFLASWAMMFGALFYSYGILRARAPSWPPMGVPEVPIVVPSIITVLILVSSVMLEQGRKALSGGDVTRFSRMMIGSIVLGALFLALQSQVWLDLWAAGLRIDTGRYGSLFFFLTIFHALHVVVGLGILCWMFWTTPRLPTSIARFARAQYAAWFWHFVALVWLIVFALVYVY